MRKSVYMGIAPANDGSFYVSIVTGKKVELGSEHVSSDHVEVLQKKISRWLKEYARTHYVKIVAIALVGKSSLLKEPDTETLVSKLWLKQDIVTFLLRGRKETEEENARDGAYRVARRFNEKQIVDIRFDPKRRVRVSVLLRISDYKRLVPKSEFQKLIALARTFRNQNGRLVFFSSTPRGGGVALMRHALIRLLRLLKVDAHWYVMSLEKSAFFITKKKFHNILQGVAPPGDQLTESEMQLYRDWARRNAEKFSEVFKRANVIVIDDPQPSGTIPYIRKVNPTVKIIYRSHIQLESHLRRRTRMKTASKSCFGQPAKWPAPC